MIKSRPKIDQSPIGAIVISIFQLGRERCHRKNTDFLLLNYIFEEHTNNRRGCSIETRTECRSKENRGNCVH